MNNSDLKIFSDLLINDEYCLLYNGNFIDAVTAKIIHITKVSLIQRGELVKTQNRLAYLMAECFQNIIRHGGHKEISETDESLPGFFMTKIKDNFYDLVTGNLIDDEAIPPLKKMFQQVNSLNDEELKILYKKTLAEGKLSDKGGAGIGLIDMAKKSAQKIEYEFLGGGQKPMFYQRLVMTADADIKLRKGNDHNIAFGIRLHNEMIDRNIIMLQKSDFARDSVMPMFSIVEENILSTACDEILFKVIYQVLTEFIHNINQHDLKFKEKKEAIFLVAKEDDTYRIGSGYFIDNNKVKLLKHYVSMVEKMEHEGLEKSFLSKIQIDGSCIKNTDVMQAIDMREIISERFSFSFTEVDEKATFFGITAVV